MALDLHFGVDERGTAELEWTWARRVAANALGDFLYLFFVQWRLAAQLVLYQQCGGNRLDGKATVTHDAGHTGQFGVAVALRDLLAVRRRRGSRIAVSMPCSELCQQPV